MGWDITGQQRLAQAGQALSDLPTLHVPAGSVLACLAFRGVIFSTVAAVGLAWVPQGCFSHC